jgi:hypothetical protein
MLEIDLGDLRSPQRLRLYGKRSRQAPALPPELVQMLQRSVRDLAHVDQRIEQLKAS